ncbi:MAG: hypothetical protein ABIH50_00475 [bacterium]
MGKTSKIKLLLFVYRTPVLITAILALFMLSKLFVVNMILMQGYHGSVMKTLLTGHLLSTHLFQVKTSIFVIIYLFLNLSILEGLGYVKGKMSSLELYDVVSVSFIIFSVLLFFVTFRPENKLSAMILFLFFLANAQLNMFSKTIEKTRLFKLFMRYAFPVSDLFFYRSQREIIAKYSQKLSIVPSIIYLGLMVCLLFYQLFIVSDAISSERLPAYSDYIFYASSLNDEGIYYSNNYALDGLCGLFYFDNKSLESKPYMRIYDLHNFIIIDGYIYYYDRYDLSLNKVNLKSKRLVWSRKLLKSSGYGSVLLDYRNNRIVVMAEAGYISVVNVNGTIIAEKEAPYLIWGARILKNNNIAIFVPDKPLVMILNGKSLALIKEITLPLDKGAIKYKYDDKIRGPNIISWMEYAKDSNLLFVAAQWGNVYIYDLNLGGWTKRINTHMFVRSLAVDESRKLLFVNNFLQGYLDVIDYSSGKHLDYILADIGGRYIVLDTKKKVGILTTRGNGMWAFDYNKVGQR